MPFKKGKSGNPEGRPPGAKNRNSEQLRDLLREFINENIEGLQKAYNSLKPIEKLRFINDILKHVISPPVNPEKLTEIQLMQIIEYLKNEQARDKTGN
jgi:hypothetical protein